ncbi:MAG: hypothetical protein CTY16_07840 [Methylobacter sp.]|nr:MAG: hypothetical protein CTY16_07840 [Methylobacter sp.]
MPLTLEASKQITSTGTAHFPHKMPENSPAANALYRAYPKKLAGLTVPAPAPAIHALRPLTKPGINTLAQLVLNGNTKNQQAFNKGKGYVTRCRQSGYPGMVKIALPMLFEDMVWMA